MSLKTIEEIKADMEVFDSLPVEIRHFILESPIGLNGLQEIKNLLDAGMSTEWVLARLKNVVARIIAENPTIQGLKE